MQRKYSYIEEVTTAISSVIRESKSIPMASSSNTIRSATVVWISVPCTTYSEASEGDSTERSILRIAGSLGFENTKLCLHSTFASATRHRKLWKAWATSCRSTFAITLGVHL
ncbi:unnamed protein product [Lepeophtheirus salmonis]|uniref:(salmon louse) hypothetical protein n=1 Tax=Lepeophtheirus salmonis TaxID=72036 RepID=A0A7R8CTJ3_LEPSM|nr:unnamed protein product [Lepeophtheirus salmonis]CAF2874429.1 unnamed protein product [Lepeophtheirus salmonis]